MSHDAYLWETFGQLYMDYLEEVDYPYDFWEWVVDEIGLYISVADADRVVELFWEK